MDAVCPGGNPFCLGLPEWQECCQQPISSADDTSLPHAVHGPTSTDMRFQHFIDDQELAELSKGFTPKNTDRNTKWALKNFAEWAKARSARFPQDPVPSDLLNSSDSELLSTWLSRYAVETRTVNGELYPPSTIYQLLTALLRIMRASNPQSPNFLDKKKPAFRQLHGTLDVHFRQLHETGIGRRVKHEEVVSKEEKDRLWKQNCMGAANPKALVNAVFYLNGKNFCLRGGEEHRNLKLSQLQRLSQPDRWIYHENCSKNRAGTFKQLHLASKVVPTYCTCNVSPERCHVHLLDFYIGKIPSSVAAVAGTFYLRPLPKKPEDSQAPWFLSTPIGRNTLSTILKKMCAEAGIEGNKTNHSLRATGATQMFQAEVPEKIIQQRTGHRSLVAMRAYERTTEEQHQAVSSVLATVPQSSSTSYTNQYLRSKEVVNFQQPLSGSSITFQGLTGCTINICQKQPSQQLQDP